MIKIYLIIIGVISFIAFISYGVDKRKSKKNKWRTPEKVLLSLGFFGGALGAIMGMKLFRHKTKHWYFWVINILGLLWQIALGVWIYISF
ncbi:MAG: DUF1294 domain-containing protein [Ruminococcaceae bacterium]|nr:DUF1294 domain-containing protein [Oscillospiraceae bacterium]